jgi:hypothetical protein
MKVHLLYVVAELDSISMKKINFFEAGRDPPQPMNSFTYE